MDSTKKYFLELLSSYINEKNPPNPPDDVDWGVIFNLATIHSVQALTYMAVESLRNKPPVYDELKAMFLTSVNISTMQEYWMERVIKALTENNIDHLLVKGYVLRNYYPDKEARTFGDVDFLIKEEDRQKSDEVLKRLGFEYDADHYIREVWTYHKGDVSLEVHTALIYEALFNDFDYTGYFNETIKSLVCIKANTYELKKEDHFLYVLVHLAKHFYNCGVGVRMVMDVAVFLNRFKQNLDFEYINNELEKLKLTKFAGVIFGICGNYFGVEVNAVDNADDGAVMEYIINHGVFGFDDKDVTGVWFHKNDDKNPPNLIKKLFPDYEYMTKYFEWFKDCPKILLPYGWVRRGLEYLTKAEKRNSFLGKVNAVAGASDDAVKHQGVLKSVGLK